MSIFKDTNLSSPVFKKLIEPLGDYTSDNPYHRICKTLSDRQILEMGILRVLSEASSGRGFLEKMSNLSNILIGVPTFFEALKSLRRLKFTRHVLTTLCSKMRELRSSKDPLSGYKELEKFDIYAGDGHYHKSSAHDNRICGKKYAVQNFYSLSLRSYSLSHLSLAEMGGERKKESDIRALKRMDLKELRQGARVGRKVLYVWDKACLDFPQWKKWKEGGVYFLSRNKTNLRYGEHEDLCFDKNDPVNQGVVMDQMLQAHDGSQVRRVLFICPIRKQTFSFITNLPKTIRPGVIAFLYRLRWSIEKVYDELKNKMNEKKAWAKTDEAKTTQALLICISFNLMVLFEDRIEQDDDIVNEKDKKRRVDRLEQDIKNAGISQKSVPDMLKKIQRITQRPIKLFRWIKDFLFSNTPWAVAIERLWVSYGRF